MKQFGIAALMLVLFATSALAVADITYVFNAQNVQAEAYNCLDSGCNTVGPFSGSFPHGASTTNGQLLVRFPTQYSAPYGYALFFVSPGYVPKEGIATWYGSGSANRNLNFDQIPMCSSAIDTFTVTNDAHANVPLVVHMSASLDAITRSAFALTTTGVGYVPADLKDVYYSADTTITLTIRDASGNAVNTQTQAMTIFASSSVPVDFSWTPATDGVYTATVTTTVTDNQCAAKTDQSSSSQFSVLPALPQNLCYTILNGLAATPFVGTTGHAVSLSFNKISNQANNYQFNDDPNYRLTPVPTDITYTVTGPAGTVAQNTFTAGANPDNMNPSAQSFSFTPTAVGMHTVTVTGLANSPLCAGLQNIPNTVTLNVNVLAPPTFNIRMHVINAQGAPLDGVTITVAGQTLTTDAAGAATATQVSPGDYTYTASKTGYVSQSGLVHLVDTDADIYMTMQPAPGPGSKVIFDVHNAITQAPIQGATISFLGHTATSGADGIATFSNVAAGAHDWSASATDYNPKSDTVTTDGNNDAQVYVAMTPINDGGPRTVTVHVTDAANGANLAGATVTISGPNSPPNGWSIATDANGNAVFNHVPQGSYAWTVQLTGYDTAQGGTDVGATDVTVPVALTKQVVPPTYSVTYHVVDAQTNAALAGASVTFNGGSAVTTDANGNVIYTQVADGTYNFGVTLMGYDPASGTTAVAGADVNVTVPLTKVNTVHQVTFHVTDGNTGIDLPGVAVSFDGRAGTTNNSGIIVFNNVPDATYNYAATLNGYGPASGSFAVAGADITVPVQMFVALHQVTFHVTDGNTGINLPGVAVSFNGLSGTTDTNGIAVFANVPDAAYNYAATLTGYNPASGSFTVAGADITVPVQMFVMVGPYTVTVHVYDDTSLANLPRAAVRFDGQQGVTDLTGTIVFHNVPAGIFPWDVNLVNYNTASGTQTVNSDITLQVPLHSNVTPTFHTVTFNVIDDASAQPIAGATITIGAATATTNGNGVASFLAADGTYTFTAAAAAYNSVTSTVTIAGSDVSVLVRMTRQGPVPPKPSPEMGIFVGSIRIPDIRQNEGDVPVLITFKNDGYGSLDNTRAVAVSTELGLRSAIGPFDLGAGEQTSARIIIHVQDVADLQPGLYPIRLTIANGDVTRVVYRDLEVLP